MTLSHLDAQGSARMVDVGDKPVTAREAVAEGRVLMSREAFEQVAEGQRGRGAEGLSEGQRGRGAEGQGVHKGDVLAVAQLAGIQAAKRTGELIPLCHPIPLDQIGVEVTLDPALPGVRVEAVVRATARTGVEMEALSAVAVACLTVYDMVKSADRAMRIEAIRLLRKTGGRSGSYSAADRPE